MPVRDDTVCTLRSDWAHARGGAAAASSAPGHCTVCKCSAASLAPLSAVCPAWAHARAVDATAKSAPLRGTRCKCSAACSGT
eukprot:3775729-Amphidinium_carterae.2